MRRLYSGFGLIEVLVTTGILSIGLLSMAALQINNIKKVSEISARARASMIAEDLVGKIRLNARYAITSAQSDYDQNIPQILNPNCINPAIGCTPAQMANHDIGEFQAAYNLDNELSSPTSTISYPGNYSIRVVLQWNNGNGIQEYITQIGI